MATRTAKTHVPGRPKPYASKKPTGAQAHLPDTALTRRCKTQRDIFLLVAKRDYPSLTPLNDYEIMALASGQYEGPEADFRTTMDAEVIQHAHMHCAHDFDRGLKLLMEGVKKILDMPAGGGGLKPELYEVTNDDPAADIRVRPIPGSEYSIRLFGDGMEDMMIYGLDFVRTCTGRPVNSPFKFELYSVPNIKVERPLGVATGQPSHRLWPIENSFGIFGKDIPPGEEKFVVNEGSACLLKRPGHRDIYFPIPIRPRPKVTLDSLPNTIMLDFE